MSEIDDRRAVEHRIVTLSPLAFAYLSGYLRHCDRGTDEAPAVVQSEIGELAKLIEIDRENRVAWMRAREDELKKLESL